jgi:acetolactate synthase-1/2/3 large subunit
VNTLTGVLGAWVDSSPLLVVTGQSKLVQTIQHTGLQGLRQYGTFEVDIVPMVKSVTKYAVFLNDAKRVRYELEKAIAIATSGRPGPVLIDIPVDIQGAQIDPEQLEGYSETSEMLKKPSEEIVRGILERLRSAKRPLILAGHGVRVSGSAELFNKWVKSLNIPVVTTPLAADLMEYSNDLYIGHPGMKGDRPGNFAIQTADVILSLGCSLHVVTTGYELDEFAPNAYKIQVELDDLVMKREQVGVHQKVQAGVGELLAVAESILSQAQKGQSTLFPKGEWHSRCLSWKKELAVVNEKHKRIGDQINYYDFNDVLSDLSAEGDTVVADAGSAFYVIGQAFRTKKNQRIIISGGLGTMGFAVPAATGAIAANPQGRVLCVTGDGSLQTNVHEFGVISHNQLNVKMFIPNNGGYVSIRNTQNNFFAGHLAGTSTSSGVSFPSLEKLAAAYGIPYFVARTRSELKDVVKTVLAQKGPVICEIFTPHEQEILPTVSSVRLESGAMKSKPLHDMYPFMDEATLKSYMRVPE